MVDNPPKLEIVSDAQLDEDEAQFRKLRRDLPGVKGASAIGIVAIGVGKIPGKTKEIGLLDGIKQWVRLYTDQENKVYKVFPAPADRFADPIWPELKPAKIFRLAFRDKGRLIDSTEHPLFKKWAARDRD
jgi:hypothetical protein